MSHSVVEDWDLVYLWTDGNHPVIRRKRRSYQKEAPYQTTNNGELQYSLLSVERYMQWHRGKIYLVTEEGIRPSLAHLSEKTRKRIVVVNQDHILPKSAKPAFNNMVIEAYLYTIPRLSNPFIYMNDDYMFGQPVQPEDFFCNGRIQLYHNQVKIPQQIKSSHNTWQTMTINTANLAIKKMHTKQQTYLCHMPYVIEKLAMNRVHQLYRAEISRMERRHACRHPSDVITLLLHNAYVSKHAPAKCAVTKHAQYEFMQLTNQNMEKNLHSILAHRPRFFTLNDRFDKRTSQVQSTLQAFFQAFYASSPHAWRVDHGEGATPFAAPLPTELSAHDLQHIPRTASDWPFFMQFCFRARLHHSCPKEDGAHYLVHAGPPCSSAVLLQLKRACARLPDDWDYLVLSSFRLKNARAVAVDAPALLRARSYVVRVRNSSAPMTKFLACTTWKQAEKIESALKGYRLT